MYNLFHLFDQAKRVPNSIYTQTQKMESVMHNGAKILKFPEKIEILNMGKGGDYFMECTKEEYDYFYKYGWSAGTEFVLLNNYEFKLNLIKDRIKTEINTRKNDKHIQNLKNRREKILQKYTARKNKLKIKLNLNDYEQKVKNHQHKR